MFRFRKWWVRPVVIAVLISIAVLVVAKRDVIAPTLYNIF